MNGTQIQTTLAPLVAILGGLLAAKVPFFDAGTWGQILGAIISTGAVVWGAIAAKKTGLATSLASYPDTKVITDKATSDATPNAPDVLSNTDVKVVAK